MVVVDGKAGPRYEQKGMPVFSGDGRYVCYFAYAGKDKKKCFVVIDGRQGGEYEALFDSRPRFHSNGALEFIAAKKGFLYRVKYIPGTHGFREIETGSHSKPKVPPAVTK